MPIRSLVPAYAAALALLVVGCGSNPTEGAQTDSGGGGSTPDSTSGAPDSGSMGFGDSSITPTDGSQDGTVADVVSENVGVGEAGLDGAGDSPGETGGDVVVLEAGDASVTGPVGTHVATGDALFLYGVTGDGYAVYQDTNAGTLYAASIANASAPVTIAQLGTTLGSSVLVQANVVLAWSNLDPNLNTGTLTVWTAAGGPMTLSTASTPGSTYFLGAASADSSRVVYLDNVTLDNADVYGAKSDGTGVTLLLPAVGLDVCTPVMQFAGTFAVASYCTDVAGAQPTISSFTAAWVKANIATNASSSFWSSDSAGTELLVFTTAHGAEVFPIGGGVGSIVDATGTFGLLTANGLNAVYGTPTALKRSPVALPAPVTLVTDVAQGMYGLSPSEQTLLYYDGVDPTTGDTDLYMASAAAAGASVVLSSTQTVALFGDAFTADSSHALYFAGYDPTTLLGALTTVPAGGSATTVLGASSYIAWATSGGKVVFNQNASASSGFADIDVVDTTAAAAPTLIVSQANESIFLSPAKDKVVYTWNVQTGAMAGLWVATLP